MPRPDIYIFAAVGILNSGHYHYFARRQRRYYLGLRRRCVLAVVLESASLVPHASHLIQVIQWLVLGRRAVLLPRRSCVSPVLDALPRAALLPYLIACLLVRHLHNWCFKPQGSARRRLVAIGGPAFARLLRAPPRLVEGEDLVDRTPANGLILILRLVWVHVLVVETECSIGVRRRLLLGNPLVTVAAHDGGRLRYHFRHLSPMAGHLPRRVLPVHASWRVLLRRELRHRFHLIVLCNKKLDQITLHTPIGRSVKNFSVLTDLCNINTRKRRT